MPNYWTSCIPSRTTSKPRVFLFQTCANLRKRRLPSIEGGGGGGKEGPQAYRSCRALLGGKAHVLQERYMCFTFCHFTSLVALTCHAAYSSYSMLLSFRIRDEIHAAASLQCPLWIWIVPNIGHLLLLDKDVFSFEPTSMSVLAMQSDALNWLLQWQAKPLQQKHKEQYTQEKHKSVATVSRISTRFIHRVICIYKLLIILYTV